MLTRTSGTRQSEWEKHPPSELFKVFYPEDWDGTLRHTATWIDEHPRIRKATGKRKRTVSPPAAVAAPVSVAPPAVEAEADGALPDLHDMLRDCDQIKRALDRLTERIQKYIDVVEN